MNRQEIYAQVLAGINRGSDPENSLPTWYASSMLRINSAMRVEEMVKHAKLAITEKLFPVPPDYQAAKSVAILTSADVKVGTAAYVPAAQLDAGWVDSDDPSFPPFWFTTRGRNIELGNWNRAGSYKFDMWYYANFPVLASDTDTNWLSVNAPHILIEMMKSFGFRHFLEFDTADRTQNNALAEIQILNQAAEMAAIPTGPLIMRPARKMGGRHS